MKQILVVCALSQELNIVRKQIKKLDIKALKIDFLQTWMWNYNTIFALTKQLENKKYDFIVNIWVAGYFWEKNEKFYQVWNIKNIFTQKELIVPTYFKFWKLATCVSSDLVVNRITGLEQDHRIRTGLQDGGRITGLGQDLVWGQKRVQKRSDEKIRNWDGFDDRITGFGQDHRIRTGTQDGGRNTGWNNWQLIMDNELWLWNKENIILKIKDKKVAVVWNFLNNFIVDMESFGFEFVCEKYAIPRIILKVPVDKIWEETDNFDYKLALELLEKNIDYEKLLLDIKKYLDKVKSNDLDLSRYFNKLYFSERQKQQFEFLYRKYQILIWEWFDKFYDDFLEENKNKTNKKQIAWKFLDKLEKYLDTKL